MTGGPCRLFYEDPWASKCEIPRRVTTTEAIPTKNIATFSSSDFHRPLQLKRAQLFIHFFLFISRLSANRNTWRDLKHFLKESCKSSGKHFALNFLRIQINSTTTIPMKSDQNLDMKRFLKTFWNMKSNIIIESYLLHFLH